MLDSEQVMGDTNPLREGDDGGEYVKFPVAMTMFGIVEVSCLGNDNLTTLPSCGGCFSNGSCRSSWELSNRHCSDARQEVEEESHHK